MLSKEEIHRYSRQIILSEIGIEGQEKLKETKVLVVGAGGLGCPVLQYLCAAGIGKIGIADDDEIDETNLQRQILFSVDEVGKNKAEVAAKKLSLLNPNCKLQTANCKLISANVLDIVRNYDLVIDCSDNFPTRYLLNDACVILKKPLVFGSIYKFEGQVSVFNYNNGPTYRCLFPEPPTYSQNCSEIGVMGVLPGIIGTLQANEVIKIITGIGEILSGKLLVFDALTANFSIITFSKVKDNDKITSLIDYEKICINKFSVKEISAEELKVKLDRKEKIQVVDVREPSEYKKFNIKGENIPLAILAEQINKIHRDIPVIIHCQRGGRSRKAVEFLQQKFGFNNLYNLAGGLEAWKKEMETEKV